VKDYKVESTRHFSSGWIHGVNRAREMRSGKQTAFAIAVLMLNQGRREHRLQRLALAGFRSTLTDVQALQVN
jgi:hypothetical protein